MRHLGPTLLSKLSLAFVPTTFALTALLTSCAPRAVTVQTPTGEMVLANADVESASIFVTSNTDENLLPSLYTPTGGLAAMKSYFDVEKKEHGDRVIWLAACHLTDELQKESGISATFQTPPTVFSLGAFKLGVFSLTHSPSTPEVQDPGAALLAQATALRKLGANLVVVMTDYQVDCRPRAKVSLKNPPPRKPDEPQAFCDGSFANALKRLPEGMINGAIVSGSGELQHFVFARYSASKTAGIPIVASRERGTSGHVIDFSVSKTANSTNFVPENTRIEGPFPIRTQGKFQGKPVTEDPRIQELLKTAQEVRAQKKKEILAHFNQELNLDPQHESSLADLAADVLRAETKADIAIMPLGIFRNAERPRIPAGPFSQADLDRLIPDSTPVTTVEVSGEQLRTLLRISETGARGFSSVSGTELRLLRPDQETKGTDLNGDGKIELWELNRLLSTGSFQQDDDSSGNGESTAIQSRKTYRLAIPLALAQGADDWKWASESMGLDKNTTSSSQQDFKVLLSDWLKQNPSVNFPTPRLKFEKLQAKNKHSKRRRGKRAKRHSA